MNPNPCAQLEGARPSGASPSAAEPAGEFEPISLGVRLTTLAAVVIPFLGLVLAVVLLWGRGFSWIDMGLLVGMYLASAVGITIGYHRLFSHRSFETHPIVKFILAALGSMAVQGPVLKWVAVHRSHHQHSDRELDPHSPNHGGCGVLGLFRGFFHAHMGWLFQPGSANLSRYIKDLRSSTSVRVASALFPFWVLVGLAIPTILGGVLTQSWMGALMGLIWGGLVRIFLIHHVTWSINSVCHLWGQRRFPSHDLSRNNVVFGLIGLGEGWHNNHHAFPTSARHGLRWWEIDLSYLMIRAMALVGLAWNIKLPSQRALALAAQATDTSRVPAGRLTNNSLDNLAVDRWEDDGGRRRLTDTSTCGIRLSSHSRQ